MRGDQHTMKPQAVVVLVFLLGACGGEEPCCTAEDLAEAWATERHLEGTYRSRLDELKAGQAQLKDEQAETRRLLAELQLMSEALEVEIHRVSQALQK